MSQEVFTIVACEHCGFKFTNPIPTEQRIGEYYKSEEYISHSDTRKGLIAKLYHLVRGVALKQKLSLITKYVSRGTLLDYGCGTGMFLSKAGKQGWNCMGIEPSREARDIASKSGFPVYQNLTEISPRCPDYSIRAVSMWHVLEHIYDLKEALEFIQNKLAKDGVLIIAVPNHSSFDAKKYGQFWAAYDVPRHLYHFTPETISRLLAQFGFERIAMHPMKFDSFYVSLLSEKYRTGKPRYLQGFISGLQSNLKAKAPEGYSSVIYVFRRKS